MAYELKLTGYEMKPEIDEFARRYGLSPREKEVFALLTQKIVHFKEIAAHLKLSPSTVNNHFKSIFEKTGTNSKSELLANFLKQVVTKLSHCRHLVRKPHVLVIDDEVDICELISEELTRRGMKVYCFSNPSEALRSLPSIKLDVIISDIRMPGMNGLELLKEIRKTHHYFPSILFVSGFSKNAALDQIMDMGAIALLEKPIDMNRLFNLIMEQFIDDMKERSRYMRLERHIPTVINEKFHMGIGTIGFGGVFIPKTDPLHLGVTGSPNSAGSIYENLDVGSLVSFQFQLGQDEGTISAVGEVAWKRSLSKDGLPPGMGVKFVQISDHDRDKILDFARLNCILSFIPMGSPSASSKVTA
jgi:FixJ family two-component response regulator